VTRADVIFHRGHLWTGRYGPADATALAVTGDRIVAVGREHDVLNLRGPDTRIVDLAGGTILPGFVDAHAHIWKIGHLLTTLLDVRSVSSLAELESRVRSHAGRLPAAAWLYGRGYNEARFPEGRGPTRHDLDAVVTDRPVVLMRTCAHIIACNTRALELAGVTRDTPTPAGGEILRGTDGDPTGVLSERAMGLVLQRMPAPTADQYGGMITAALEHQLSRGITSTNDAGVAPELLDVYRQLDASGRLPARVNVMALRLVDGVGVVPLPRRRYVTTHLRIDTVKFFADGGLSGATAALSVPYRHADTRGVLRMDEREFLALAHEAHDAGWRIATHAIGDVAIDQVLGVYGQLGTQPVRHRIEHFGLPTDDQLARAARRGIIAVPQTIFVNALGRNFRNYLPDTLLPRAYPVRAMLDAGITVALSSDAPVVENDSPLAGIEAALTRQDAEGHVIAGDQAISLDEALDAYTRGGAIASGDDDTRGTLERGRTADLTILSGDIRTTPPDGLTSLAVVQTWVGGRLAYSAH
jgi:predicted amidohydrolase YtcJ